MTVHAPKPTSCAARFCGVRTFHDKLGRSLHHRLSRIPQTNENDVHRGRVYLLLRVAAAGNVRQRCNAAPPLLQFLKIQFRLPFEHPKHVEQTRRIAGIVIRHDGQIDESVAVFVRRLEGNQHRHIPPDLFGEIETAAVFRLDFNVHHPVARLALCAVAEPKHDCVGLPLFRVKTIMHDLTAAHRGMMKRRFTRRRRRSAVAGRPLPADPLDKRRFHAPRVRRNRRYERLLDDLQIAGAPSRHHDRHPRTDQFLAHPLGIRGRNRSHLHRAHVEERPVLLDKRLDRIAGHADQALPCRRLITKIHLQRLGMSQTRRQ